MKRLITFFLRQSIFIVFTLFSFTSGHAQCVTYVVNVCIDGEDKLHIKGNQMWWQHIAFQPPGQHPSCSSYGVGIQVNGNNWGIWDSAYTIANVSCATLTDSTLVCAHLCSLVQSPDSANGWETIYDFNDDALGGPHVYEHSFTFCYIDSALQSDSISAPPTACLGDTSLISVSGLADTSTSAVYYWNFAGGEVVSGSGKGPYLVKWPNTGAFPVSLFVSNGCGNSGTVTDTVQVRPRPESIFAAPVSLCANADEFFTYMGNASDSASYNWNFGTGNIISGSGAGPFVVSWADADTVANVSLSVYDNGCTSYATSQTLAINTFPGLSIQPAADTICPGDSVTLNASGAVSYNWEPAYGLNNTTGPSVVASPAVDTTYFIVAANGLCADTARAVVSVGSVFNAGNITVSADTICSGKPVILTDPDYTGPLQWQLSTGIDFTNIQGAESDSLISSPSQTTSYRVVAGTDGCANVSSPVQVTVNPVPVVLITASDTLFCSSDSARLQCEGNFTSYSWNNGDSLPFIYVQDAGGYSLTVTDANGCSAVSNHQNVNVYPVSSVSIIVQGDTLSSFGASSYQWYLDDTLIPGANLSVYIAPAPGAYSVEITDTNGCTEPSSQVNINIVGAGVQDMPRGTYFNIFPNPFTTYFVIQANDATMKIEQAEVYDVLGRMVFIKKMNALNAAPVKLVVNGLAEGVYYVKVRINGTDYTKQIVRE